MKINISDKIIAWLALLSGLSISAVAIYYSVAGLVSIFAAAAIPIMVMGVVLEVGKLSATVWLKQNWLIAPRFLKTYLLIAITVLMLITSMGIFGYLSKAHLDQAVPTGDVADKVALIDEKIRTEKENIDASRRALKQMDEAVDQTMSRSDSEQAAQRAVQIRRNQQAERGRLQKDIATAQSNIAKLNEERAPIAKELRKVEAEVGPIKYIAALIYGDNPDSNLLEAAVRWVIIIIVIVFDPLAVILLLASQYSFSWFRQKEEQDPEKSKDDLLGEEMASDSYELEKLKDPEPADTGYVHSPWPFPVAETPVKEEEFKFLADDNDLYPEGKPWEEQPKEEDTMRGEYDFSNGVQGAIIKPESLEEKESDLDKWNKMLEEAEKAVEEEKEIEDHEILENAPHTEKEAMAKWKSENPDSSLKIQRKLLERGVIDKLPWEHYLEPKPDFIDAEDEAAIEAAKWAQEQIEKQQSKKKDSNLDGERGSSTGEKIQGTITGYQQNAEQNENTIWNRIQENKK
jgi:hypothetical protein